MQEEYIREAIECERKFRPTLKRVQHNDSRFLVVPRFSFPIKQLSLSG